MLYINLILFFCSIENALSLVSKVPNAQISPTSSNVPIQGPGSLDALKTKTLGLRFRVPFMDMEIKNERNLHIMQERQSRQQIYALHGNQLYQMFIDHEGKRLSFVGYLSGSVRESEPLAAEVIIWRDYLILVIAMDEYLEVYQIALNVLKARAEETKKANEIAPTFDTIQQLTLLGQYRHHFLTYPNEKQFILIVGINFTRLYGRLHTFLWSTTYFEPIEEAVIPPLHFMSIIGKYPKYLIRGRLIKHQAKTILTISEIQTPSLILHTTQTLTVNSHIVHAATFGGKQYLVACSNQEKTCNSFRMGGDGLFSVYKHRLSKDLAFDKFASGESFLVASRLNQVMVYVSGRLDRYTSFTSNESDITSILTLTTAHDESFILLIYRRPFRTLVRMVELESESGGLLGSSTLNMTEGEDSSPLLRHRHMFEETIGNLRSLLLKRRNAMNVFRKIPKELKQGSPEQLDLSYPVNIYKGNIKRVHIVDPELRSPLQLRQRVAELRHKYFQSSRPKRDINENSHSSPERLKVKHLRVRNLVYKGDLLEGFHLDQRAQPLPILSVRPKLVAKELSTQKLLTLRTYRRPRQFEATSNISSMKLSQLNVKSINNVSWDEFLDSLFLKHRDTQISGRLILQSETKIINLTTPLLNGIVVDEIFNLAYPQVVHSNILFSGFLVKTLHAESINGLDFAKDVVFQNTESFIETPVNIYRLSIEKDLLLGDNVTIQRSAINEKSDFKQFYTGKVTINGSLTVRNLASEKPENSRISIDGHHFSKQQIKQQYLLRNKAQAFNSPLEFANSKVTVPSLTTNFLNGHPVDELILINQTQYKNPLKLIFLNAIIKGNLESKDFRTHIANVSKDAVHQGDVVNITGSKVFAAPLIIDDLMTLTINQMPVSELVLKTQLKNQFQFRNSKTFEGLQVTGDCDIRKRLHIAQLNRLPLDEFLGHDYKIEMLNLPFKLQATNIVFHKINGLAFDEVFNNFKIIDEQLVLHKQLIIEGNIKFAQNLVVKSINGLDWSAYEKDLVRVNENAIISGRKQFLKELTFTGKLKSPVINDLQLEEIFQNILSKSQPQVIRGNFTFGNLCLNNLDVSAINDRPTADFIDIREENLTLKSDLIVPKVSVDGDISSANNASEIPLQDLMTQVGNLLQQNVRNLVVIGNASCNSSNYFNKSQREMLSYLQRNAVRRNGHQVISGNVKLLRPIVRNVFTKADVLGDIDFKALFEDCIYKNSNQKQIIEAEKAFLFPLHLQNVNSGKLFSTHLVNGIDVQRLNSSLFRLSSDESIKGPIRFLVPPKIEHLMVEQNINGINPEVIYHNLSSIIPPIKIRNLFINDSLQIGEINDKNVDAMLEERLVKNSPESLEITDTLTFENLILEGNNRLHTINGIPTNNLVLKKSDRLQTISGKKVILGDLTLAGPAHVLRLNGLDLVESYQKSSERNSQKEQKEGLVGKQRSQMEISSTFGGLLHEANEENRLLEKVEQKLYALSKSKEVKMKDLLYLDYVSNWRIEWRMPNSTAHKTYRHELKGGSLCERRFLDIQVLPPSNDHQISGGSIFFRNITTNLISAHAKLIPLSVKAENFCQHEYRKMKSKITITNRNFTKVIGMRKFIENIFIFSTDNQSDTFILLHALDLTSNHHEVRVLKLPKGVQEKVTDWQSLTLGIGKTLRLFQFPNYTLFVSSGGMVDNKPVTVIYNFNSSTNTFEISQTIPGDYDIYDVLSIEMHQQYNLILSCHRCQHVYIYDRVWRGKHMSYQIFQILKLKTLITKLMPFSLDDGSRYLLFLSEGEHSHYYLYRFTQLQGWIHTTYGYFNDTEMALPLSDGNFGLLEGNLLVLLCSQSRCSLVKAVVI